MTVDIESIQPGWTVVDANGEEVGKVVDTEGGALKVKKGGFLGGEVQVSRNAITEVETGRVEINQTKNELG